MTAKAQNTITRAEFDRRLNALNYQREEELQRIEAKQEQVEAVLTHYEQMLGEIEASLDTKDKLPSQTAHLRARLQELATKTAEVAALL